MSISPDARRPVIYDSTGRWIESIVERFEAAWEKGPPPAIDDCLPPDGRYRLAALIELVHVDLVRRLKRGEAVRAEEYLERYPELAASPAAIDLIAAEFALRRRSAPQLSVDEFVARFPQWEAELHQRLAADDNGEGTVTSAHISRAGPLPRSDSLKVEEDGDVSPPPAEPMAAPEQIGRYRVERVLGQGGFGLVYLAHDDQLKRPVAIKVPHARLVAQPSDAEAYLVEARTVANLDHPNIVPVHDVGSSDSFPCYVVSKYVDGVDLASRLERSRLPLEGAVELIAIVADALHHAHKQGLVHRDIKPSNILLDKSGKPYVADFGLALREQDVGRGPRYCGTPIYMSPEQARGEGHRVDGRSDLFSLGVVLYELLTGHPPFKAKSRSELLEQIAGLEARPPRQIDDQIPRELERICLKALSKRASERFTTTKDFADDLRHFLADASVEVRSAVTGSARTEGDVSTPPTSPVPTPNDRNIVKIVPKGLRSFDAGDADFFLELLPGARDREGLPDSIRFWRKRIEETNPEQTFPVGLIYGPSGCGKSSLVKAGLLPRLAEHITTVYVEATAEETETRLLKAVRRQTTDLPGNLGLVDSLAALRQGRFLEPGQKVLFVIDQFEQWLHANRGEEGAELVQALRQCDGGRVQCIVMVRDDFWLAVSRFMQALEVCLIEGSNSALVDLFDSRHARKVLTAFGVAFGAIEDAPAGLSKDEKAFVDQAVAGLAEEGKIVCVRLALFAEMVKGKPWTTATLNEVGGTAGVGVTFLEETFAASTAPPRHRVHQKAAQAVLKALLPDAGTDIKGHMRSQKELLEASGYVDRPKDFDELLRILDSELRLITPTDAEGVAEGMVNNKRQVAGDQTETAAVPSPAPSAAHRLFQLTHDYLVLSLRDWLTRKQRETRRGRAELRLAERSALWTAKPENRHLPSLAEFLRIRFLTNGRNWTEPQRWMMGRAARIHGIRSTIIAAGLVIAIATGLTIRNGILERDRTSRAEVLVARLENAEARQIPDLIGDLNEYRSQAKPLLMEKFERGDADSPQRLYAALALLPDDAKANYLLERLLTLPPQQFGIVFPALLIDHKDDVVALAKAELQRFAPAKSNEDDKEALAKRQAVAAVALYRSGIPEMVWPLLKGPLPGSLPVGERGWDLRVRSYIIHWLSPLAADPQTIIKRLDEEPDVTIQRALVLALGEFSEAQLPVAERKPLIEKLLLVYENQSDPGLHGAAEWLLRQWGAAKKLEAINDKLRTNERRVTEMAKAPLSEKQERQLTELNSNVEGIQNRLMEAQKTLPERQTAWERKLLEQPPPPLASLQEALIAHYPLDETAGTETSNAVKDQPGATYHGKGKPEWVPGVFGGALRLDGTGTMVGGRPLDLECDQPFSYGCWFQYNARIPMVIISTRDRTKGFRGFDLSLEDDHQLRMQIAGEAPDLTADKRKEYFAGYSPNFISVIATTSVDPGRRPGWHHVMVAYDGSKKARGVSIFVDGQPQPIAILDDKFVGTMKANAPIYIGSRYGVYNFRGQIDDVRIYDRRLSEQDVRQLFESGVKSLAGISASDRTVEQQELLANVYRPEDPLIPGLERQLAAAQQSIRSLRDSKRDLSRRWYINAQGQSFVILDAGEFLMGSPRSEVDRYRDEPQHHVHIGRRFAIAATLVTREQFGRFQQQRPEIGKPNQSQWVKTADSPATSMTWYETAQYCNWLSKQEGIEEKQWCYEPNEQKIYGPGMKPKEKYLELAGYRLPTEAEWEFACRAETVTSRYYGQSATLLARYAWYLTNSQNRTWPVSSLKPNDYGLFDMEGNAWQWCDDAYHSYPSTKVFEDAGSTKPVAGADDRVLRGASFNNVAELVRSAYRAYLFPPESRDFTIGFRPVRTLP